MKNNLDHLSRDYARVAEAIRYIDRNAEDQPELKSVARHVGLSETHFQKLFSRWAGISPKRFLQYVTLEHTRRLLRESNNTTLSTSIEAGLSSVSRLHDLYVKCEAMTPGEYRTLGEGLTIRYGTHPTPFGKCLIATTDRGVCGLIFLQRDEDLELADLQRKWKRAVFEPDPIHTREVRDRIFTPLQNGDKPLYLLLKGTPFQVKVWEALLKIPCGQVTTYQTVAKNIRHAEATRAVANAVAGNPLHYLIPCHRVIRSSGALGGYRGGVTRKKALLGWETAKLEVEAAHVAGV